MYLENKLRAQRGINNGIPLLYIRLKKIKKYIYDD
jgi:hypothetical protein